MTEGGERVQKVFWFRNGGMRMTEDAWELAMRRLVDYAPLGINYRMECSTNLSSNVWNTVLYEEFSVETDATKPDYETVRITLPDGMVDENNNLFIRASYE